MKSAQHELKGYNALAPLVGSIDGLDVPLAATVDYRGFRLLAVSLLPLVPPRYQQGVAERRLASPGSLVCVDECVRVAALAQPFLRP